jgi:hypothetical protein
MAVKEIFSMLPLLPVTTAINAEIMNIKGVQRKSPFNVHAHHEYNHYDEREVDREAFTGSLSLVFLNSSRSTGLLLYTDY